MSYLSGNQTVHAGIRLLLFTLFAGAVQAQTVFTETPAPDYMTPEEISALLDETDPSEGANPAPLTSPQTTSETAISLATSQSADVPSDIVLLLDNSGSMKANDPQFLTAKAVTDFINQLDLQTRLGIVIFDQKVTLAHPLSEVNAESRSDMLNSLQQINYKGLRTNSPDGLERAIYELKLHARENTERFIVFLTDGIVDTGDKQKDATKLDWMRKELAADANDNDIKIFGIAFTDGADFQLIQSLAQQTNAEYFRAYSADKLAAVFTQIQDKISRVRQEALTAELEANKPPPAPIIVAPPPVAPPKPIIVQVPESPADKTTQYLLYGIAGLLLLVIAIVLLRGRAAGSATVSAGEKMPDVKLMDLGRVSGQEAHPLTTEITQIGRIQGKEADGVTHIVIPEKSISRHHAVIEYRNHAFWVMDQGSGNGSKLNNLELTEECRLKHGDILTFDKFNFMFSEPAMEQSDATVLQASDNQAEAFADEFDRDETAMLSSADEEPDDVPTSLPSTTPQSVTKDDAEKEKPAKDKKEFNPAETMSPDQFDQLFSEMDDDKK